VLKRCKPIERKRDKEKKKDILKKVGRSLATKAFVSFLRENFVHRKIFPSFPTVRK
jgi:hypothetical protein